MITTEQIVRIINSLEDYKGPKWNPCKVYQYLHDSYVEEIYSPYCKSCDACGHDGCCPATMCNFGPKCQYRDIYLNDLKYGYYVAEDLIKLIYDTDNQELINKMHFIFDENRKIVYEKERD